ncbi:MAG: TIGR04282 family arsenosugar biosynthesis glycosyltransferase [Alphaproteobacteria bacterium]
MRPGRTVIVFARAPRIGRVKRRLARDVGAVAAWRLYRDWLARVLRALGGDRRWRLVVAVTPDHVRRPLRGVAVTGQGKGDLGRRMARALDRAPPGPAVVVGSDIPELRARHVAAAFQALRRSDVVVGPAGDGGFWLIGRRHRLRRLPPFAGVRWSTRHALEDTLRCLPPEVSVGRADRLDDVDDGASLRAWRRRGNRGNVPA